MEKTIDCIVCGTCTVDILVKPFPVESAIGGGKLVRVDPIEATTGGIVSNSGMTLARLGMRVTAFTYLGDDEWAPIVKSKHRAERIDTSGLITHPTAPTSATAVLVDASGERSFAHHPGRYMTRCPFSLSRLVKVTETGQVVYKAEKQACRAFPHSAEGRASDSLLRPLLQQVPGHAQEGGSGTGRKSRQAIPRGRRFRCRTESL